MLKKKPIDIAAVRHLYPFLSHYLELDGLKYHYIDEGAGDPIVMLHGNPTWSFYYRELIPALCRHYRTIVPDHIGCGLSDKPGPADYDYRLQNRIDDLDQLLESLAVSQKITLVLHDWGGMIGMGYALRHPEKISRLVVMNTAAFLPPSGKRIPMRLRIIRNSGPLAVPAVLGLNLFAWSALYLASHRGLSKEVKLGLTAPYNCWKNRIATLKFVQDIPLTAKDPSYALVEQAEQHLQIFSKLPILICWGLRDFVFDNDYLLEWQRRFPKAQVHRFADAGHYVLEDASEKIIPLIEKFLKQYPL